MLQRSSGDENWEGDFYSKKASVVTWTNTIARTARYPVLNEGLIKSTNLKCYLPTSSHGDQVVESFYENEKSAKVK